MVKFSIVISENDPQSGPIVKETIGHTGECRPMSPSEEKKKEVNRRRGILANKKGIRTSRDTLYLMEGKRRRDGK